MVRGEVREVEGGGEKSLKKYRQISSKILDLLN